MSPEYLMDLALDGRADLFALGVVFFEMLAGKRPLDGPTPYRCAVEHRRLSQTRSDEAPGGLLLAHTRYVRPLLVVDRYQRMASSKALLGQLSDFESAESTRRPSSIAQLAGAAMQRAPSMNPE